jgi:uncharacterized protein YjiS (DUF1127 family)
MSMLHQAPASAAAGRGELLSNVGQSLWRGLGRFRNAWQGRKLVMDMRDFDDAQLADIGLKRSDVETALQLPYSADPSLYLVRARENPLRGVKRL